MKLEFLVRVSSVEQKPFIDSALVEFYREDGTSDVFTVDRSSAEYKFTRNEYGTGTLYQKWSGISIVNSSGDILSREELYKNYAWDGSIHCNVVGVKIEKDAPEGYAVLQIIGGTIE